MKLLTATMGAKPELPFHWRGPQNNVHSDKTVPPWGPGDPGARRDRGRGSHQCEVPGEPPVASSFRTAAGAAAWNLISLPNKLLCLQDPLPRPISGSDRKPGFLTAVQGAKQMQGTTRHPARIRGSWRFHADLFPGAWATNGAAPSLLQPSQANQACCQENRRHLETPPEPKAMAVKEVGPGNLANSMSSISALDLTGSDPEISDPGKVQLQTQHSRPLQMTLASLVLAPNAFPCSLLDQRSLHIHSNPHIQPSLSQHPGQEGVLGGPLMLPLASTSDGSCPPKPRPQGESGECLVLPLPRTSPLTTHQSEAPGSKGPPSTPKRVDICGEAPGAPGATGRALPWGQARQEDPWGPGRKPTGSAPTETTSPAPPISSPRWPLHVGSLSSSHLSAPRASTDKGSPECPPPSHVKQVWGYFLFVCLF